MIKNTIFYLIGFPGTGKYTIAKEICQLKPDIRLVDAHLINNPIFSLIPLDGKTNITKRTWANRVKIWKAVFDTMIYISPREFSFVLTNYLSQNDPEDVAWFEQVKAMAEAREALFVPVRLIIDPVEHKSRIVSSERKDRYKETNPDAPARYAAEDRLIEITHPNLLELDVTSLNPEEAAKKIITHALEF